MRSVQATHAIISLSDTLTTMQTQHTVQRLAGRVGQSLQARRPGAVDAADICRQGAQHKGALDNEENKWISSIHLLCHTGTRVHVRTYVHVRVPYGTGMNNQSPPSIFRTSPPEVFTWASVDLVLVSKSKGDQWYLSEDVFHHKGHRHASPSQKQFNSRKVTPYKVFNNK